MSDLPERYVPKVYRHRQEEKSKPVAPRYAVGYARDETSQASHFVFGPLIKLEECLEFIPDMVHNKTPFIWRIGETVRPLYRWDDTWESEAWVRVEPKMKKRPIGR
jgi:hypothetical protein